MKVKGPLSKGRRFKNGDKIEQHPLLTKHQWNRLHFGEIKQFTYWSLYGPYEYGNRQARSFILTKKDCP